MDRVTKKEQIYLLMKERLKKRIYVPGSRLPKEVELSVELGISRKTLRPVLEQLAMENRIERIKGKGTFIRNTEDSRTKILVIVHDSNDVSNPYLYIMPGVQLAAEKLNVSLESCSAASLLSRSMAENARQILENGFKGILWFASNFNGGEPLLETLRKTNLPVLLPHASRKDRMITGFSVMGTDYRKVIEDGLRYLAAQGHRRVGNISMSEMRGISVDEYFQCVRAAGLEDDPELLCLTANDAKEDRTPVVRAAAHLMKELKNPPTALFCFSDFFALHVYEYLHKNDIRIPDDVAVLSIGGQIGCDFLDPPLSAIDFGSLDIGRSAVRVLLKMICEKRRIPFLVTPHHIKERQSSKRTLQDKNDHNAPEEGRTTAVMGKD